MLYLLGILAPHGDLLFQRVPVAYALTATDVAIADGVEVIHDVLGRGMLVRLFGSVLAGVGGILAGGRALVLGQAQGDQQQGQNADAQESIGGTHDNTFFRSARKRGHPLMLTPVKANCCQPLLPILSYRSDDKSTPSSHLFQMPDTPAT